jgi:hypothetical protein
MTRAVEKSEQRKSTVWDFDPERCFAFENHAAFRLSIGQTGRGVVQSINIR